MIQNKKIAVVIPCYRVATHILGVISSIDKYVDNIYVVDDRCPEFSGKIVTDHCADERVKVIFNSQNLGVGGAVISGYLASLKDDNEIVVKIDGDGQMDPTLLINFVVPIIKGEADYSKGNRFFDLEHINRMPKIRLIGNSILSFANKISSGYWDIFDPTNGYTAIHQDLIRKISFNRVSPRYFFESDMLFRLNILKAVVVDVPMDAYYGDEKSSLNIFSAIPEFFVKHMKNFAKRVFYNYYLRDMSVASLELPLGISLIFFGMFYSVLNWYHFGSLGIPTPLGTVMIAALALLFGLQFLLAFLAYDISSVPRRPIHHVKSIDSHKLVARQ
jgi:glycosyltransferase involved in cell wall biosynthesis